jgi:hypothetical protein
VKAQCASCREIVSLDFRLAEGGIDVSCGACGETYFVAAAAPSPVTPRVGEAIVCPKCGREQAPAEACRGCGLLVERFDEFRRRDDEDVPPAVVAAWERCLAAWDDAAEHERLVEVVAAHRAYGWGARRYRDALRGRPDDAVARARLTRMARMAEAALRSTATPRPEPRAKEPFKGAVVLLVVLAFIAVVSGVYAMFRTRAATGSDTTGTRTPATKVPGGGAANPTQPLPSPGATPPPRR